jgi:hypothetical protein
VSDGLAPVPGARKAIGRYLVLFCAIFVVFSVFLWWAMGLRTFELAPGFNDRRVPDYRAQGTMLEIVGGIRPHAVVHFEDPSDRETRLMIAWDYETEQELARGIADLCERQIIAEEGTILVCALPWLEQSHRWAAHWARKHLGVRPWSNRSGEY